MSDAGGATPTQPYGQPAAPPPEEGGESFAQRLALAQRAGGAVAPLLTVLLAFVMGGLVVLVTTGKNPINTYRAIFDGSGLNWFFQIPWDTGSNAAFNLQQTLIYTTTLILVGLAVAFAFRCGLFNIGGLGQYLAGSILAVWVGSSFQGMSPIPHVLLVLVIGTLAGAFLAGIAGFLKATVGAHEVITTIMLNWTVVWVGLYLFGHRRAAPERHGQVRPDLERRRRGGEAPRLLGRPAAPGAPHRLLHRARRAGRLLGGPEPHDARVWRQGGRVQPGGRAVRRDQRRPQLLPRHGDLGRVRGHRGRDRHPRLAVPGLDRRREAGVVIGHRVHGHRRRAARPQHGLGNFLRGTALRLRSSPGRRPATSIPRSSSRSSRRTSRC